MKFKTKMISTAVVAALGSIAGTAQAVNLGEDGQGQVLIYPYYTVQQKGTTAYDTYVTVVNSDSVNGKAVKVRFLEGKNSREVLDFNLYLSPNDVWTGAITRDASGNGLLRTWDNSCTAPEIPVVSGTQREVAFVNYAYDGANDDAAENDLGRTREGYVEIIQMADVVSGLLTTAAFDTWVASKHNAAGVPANCAGIRNAWTTGDYTAPANDGVAAPTGGLGGSGTIINPLEGTDIGYPAVAMENFRNVAQHNDPGNILPNLAQATPQISDVFAGNRLVRTNWTADIGLGTVSPVAPVSAIIMRDQVQNEYAAAAAPVGLSTDWVISFPTKAQHLAMSTLTTSSTLRQPFLNWFASTGSCETVVLTAYNREEATQTSGLIFSPPPPAGVNRLCWEINVVRLNGPGGTPASNALGSLNLGQGLNLPYTEGWLRMQFSQATQQMVSAAGASTAYPLGGAVAALANPVTYFGLPVVGFMAQTFVNTTSLAAYGEAYPHRYTRRVTP